MPTIKFTLHEIDGDDRYQHEIRADPPKLNLVTSDRVASGTVAVHFENETGKELEIDFDIKKGDPAYPFTDDHYPLAGTSPQPVFFRPQLTAGSFSYCAKAEGGDDCSVLGESDPPEPLTEVKPTAADIDIVMDDGTQTEDKDD